MKDKIDIKNTRLAKFIGVSYFDKAYAVATHCHRNDYRRDGEPYINHLIRVAEQLVDLGVLYVVVGLLHDSVEDGHITLDELAIEGFSEEIRNAIDDLSRRKDVGESYYKFIMRVVRSKNTYSRLVKLADLRDNMVDGKEGSQLDKYRLAAHILATEYDTKDSIAINEIWDKVINEESSAYIQS